MIAPEFIIENLRLPSTWEFVKQGVEKDDDGEPNRIYIVLSTPTDVISILVYLNLKADDSSIKVGWKLNNKFEHRGHEISLLEHPCGARRQYIWYCPNTNATFMINFTLEPDSVWEVCSKIRCH